MRNSTGGTLFFLTLPLRLFIIIRMSQSQHTYFYSVSSHGQRGAQSHPCRAGSLLRLQSHLAFGGDSKYYLYLATYPIKGMTRSLSPNSNKIEQHEVRPALIYKSYLLGMIGQVEDFPRDLSNALAIDVAAFFRFP